MQSVGRVTSGLLFSWFVRRLLSLARRYYQQMQHRKIMLRHVSTPTTNSCQVYNTIFHLSIRSTNNTIGEQKNQRMTQVKMFIHFRLTQHVSGIIMPIVRRQTE